MILINTRKNIKFFLLIISIYITWQMLKLVLIQGFHLASVCKYEVIYEGFHSLEILNYSKHPNAMQM